MCLLERNTDRRAGRADACAARLGCGAPPLKTLVCLDHGSTSSCLPCAGSVRPRSGCPCLVGSGLRKRAARPRSDRRAGIGADDRAHGRLLAAPRSHTARVCDLVGVAQLQIQVLAVELGPVADPADHHPLGEASATPSTMFGEQRPGQGRAARARFHRRVTTTPAVLLSHADLQARSRHSSRFRPFHAARGSSP